MAVIVGDNNANSLVGTEEADLIAGFGGNDTIDSVDRPSNPFAGSINPVQDLVDAGSGDDSVTGGRLDQLDGGAGNDFLSLNFNFNGPEIDSGAPVVLTLDETGTGTASDGTFITNFESVFFTLTDAGDDEVNTGNVRATLDGQGGADILTTGSGDDVVFGGGGNDIIFTGAGNDTISGGGDSDTVDGGAGDDTFGVNLLTDGQDFVNLGTGNDTVRFDRFDGGSGNIRLTFTSAEVGNGNVNDAGNLNGQDGGLAVRVQNEDADGNLVGDVSRYDDEGITFVAGTQGITFDVRDLVSGTARGNTFEGVVLGTDGNDSLSFFPPFREAQDFYYNAGAGDDTVNAGSGNDFIVGGAGNDRLFGGAGNDTFLGGNGDDLIVGEDGNDYLVGGAGLNVMDGGAGVDAIEGGSDRDIIGGKAGNDVIRAGAGADYVDGGADSDALFGDDGEDLIIGGTGNDVLTGGAGSDVFLFQAGDGSDIITDFVAGSQADAVALQGTGFTSFADVQANLSFFSGGNATVLQIGSEQMFFVGVRPEQFDSSDFFFI